MLGLADVEALALERVDRLATRRATGGRFFCHPLCIDDVPLDMVEGHRVGREKIAL